MKTFRSPLAEGQKDMIDMALCTWCGHQTENDAEYCGTCGGYPGRPPVWSGDPTYEAAEGRRLEYLQDPDSAAHQLKYVPSASVMSWQPEFGAHDSLWTPEYLRDEQHAADGEDRAGQRPTYPAASRRSGGVPAQESPATSPQPTTYSVAASHSSARRSDSDPAIAATRPDLDPARERTAASRTDDHPAPDYLATSRTEDDPAQDYLAASRTDDDPAQDYLAASHRLAAYTSSAPPRQGDDYLTGGQNRAGYQAVDYSADDHPVGDYAARIYRSGDFPRENYIGGDPADYLARQRHRRTRHSDREPADDFAPADFDSPDPDAKNGRWARKSHWTVLAAALTVVIIAATTVVLALLLHNKPSGSAASNANRHHAGASSEPSANGPASPPASGGPIVSVTDIANQSPAAPAVVAVVTHYVAAINSHNFRAYRRLFASTSRSSLTRSGFVQGYGTTHDSRVMLRRIGGTVPGELTAVLSFTSHQQPGQSPTGTACTRWRITLFLVNQGQQYFLVAPPSSYTPTFRTCGS